MIRKKTNDVTQRLIYSAAKKVVPPVVNDVNVFNRLFMIVMKVTKLFPVLDHDNTVIMHH